MTGHVTCFNTQKSFFFSFLREKKNKNEILKTLKNNSNEENGWKAKNSGTDKESTPPPLSAVAVVSYRTLYQRHFFFYGLGIRRD